MSLNLKGKDKLRDRFLWKQRGRCFYCAAKMASFKEVGDPLQATFDHYLPRALGGTDNPSNLVLACAGCNGRKADMAPADFHALIKADAAKAGVRA